MDSGNTTKGVVEYVGKMELSAIQGKFSVIRAMLADANDAFKKSVLDYYAQQGISSTSSDIDAKIMGVLAEKICNYCGVVGHLSLK